jgi:DnaA family protein
VPIQLPLQFEFQSNQHFNTFFQGNNKEIINHLQQLFIKQEQQIYLWGEAGIGKTHLLHASIQDAKNQNKSSFYFSLDTPDFPDPSILEGLENLDLVCFDNIQKIAGNTEWEQAFFNFYNLHREGNKKLVLSAPCPPKYLSIELPDLKTRMSWGLTLKLKALTDEQQLNALIYKANELGFEIPLNVGRFLITRYVRDLASIWILLDKINHATLAAKRKLTIPFLKQIMENNEPS